MKVAITGAAGFIGANLCRHLERTRPDIDMCGIDDLSSGFSSNLDGVGVDLTVGSILDREVLNETLQGASVIVHLAARPSVPRSIQDPSKSHDANATGTLKVLEAARNLDDPLVIVASSSSVYGANPTLPKVESLVPMPMSPYAVSKLATEQYTMAWQYSYGMRTLAFRFFNVFGPFQAAGHAYAAAIPAFVSAALAGEPLAINGDGLQTRDFTYVETLCSVIGQAIERQVSSPTPINLAFGTRTSVLDLITMIEDITGVTTMREHGPERVGDVKHSQADNSLLRATFPEVSPIDLRIGLTRTIEWAKSQRAHAS